MAKKEAKEKKEQVVSKQDDMLYKAISTTLPAIIKEHGYKIAQTAITEKVGDMFATVMNKLSNDTKFIKSLEESVAKVIFSALDKIDTQHLANELKKHMSNALDDFEFCELAHPLEEKLKSVITSMHITLSVGNKKQ